MKLNEKMGYSDVGNHVDDGDSFKILVAESSCW